MVKDTKSIKDVKYFQKLKCEKHTHDLGCNDFTQGVDITSTIKPILEGIDNLGIGLIKSISKHRCRKMLGDLCKDCQIYEANVDGLQKAKQIIEENVIKEEK